MQKGLLAGSSPFTQLIMLAFTMVSFFLLCMFIGILFMFLIPGVSITDIISALNNQSGLNLNLMRYLMILQGISLFIIPAFFAAYLFSGDAIGYLCLGRNSKPETQNPQPVKWFGAVLLLMLMAIPFINLLASLNEMIVFPEILSGLEQRLKASEEAARQMVKLFTEVDNVGGMFFNIFMMAMLPALGEEMIFRGVVQKIFVRWTGNVHAAIIITGFLFSLMHLQFYGFFPRWLLGVMFGYLMVWSGTLWLPIFAHFVNNTVCVCLSYLIHRKTIPETLEVFGANGSDIPVTIVATAISAWLLWKIYQFSINPSTARLVRNVLR